MYQSFFPFTALLKKLTLSERELSKRAAISRGAVRAINSKRNVTIESIEKAAATLDREILLLASPKEMLSQYSTVATSLAVERDGFDSWKIHFFNLVDEFRRTLDPRLILLPPHSGFDGKLTALLASIVRDLCEEAGVEIPFWVNKRYFLEAPWFVSGFESLKASALVESPLPYRLNNIFVQKNFLERA